MSESEILVSVWMPTYFAGAYVGQAIDSILMQETDYRYEIVIGDDCSDDNTWTVISEYAEKYPDIIRATRNEINLGLTANVLSIKKRCRGKYIVNLAGDDYWIDPKKIQKQVDFLEEHPDYVGVATRIEQRYGDSQSAAGYNPSEQELNHDFTVDSFNRLINLPAHGLMLRNIFKDPANQELIDRVYGVSKAIDDLYDPALFLQYGKIYIMADVTCVYRLAADKKAKRNFNSLHRPFEKGLTILDGYIKLEELQLENINLAKHFQSVMNILILSGIALRRFGDIRKAYKTIPVRYRKPWYRSVAMKCAFSVWGSAYRQVKKRVIAMLKKN